MDPRDDQDLALRSGVVAEADNSWRITSFVRAQRAQPWTLTSRHVSIVPGANLRPDTRSTRNWSATAGGVRAVAQLVNPEAPAKKIGQSPSIVVS